MSNILDIIVEQKKREVEKLYANENPVSDPGYSRQCISLKKNLVDPGMSGIIAEFKRRSPSKGWLNQQAVASEVVSNYEKFGASCASVLTDEKFFGGSLNDLREVRKVAALPLLRKDFIIDEIQIKEARINGADVILLIAAILSPLQVNNLTRAAHELGLEVLLELHDHSELGHIDKEVDMIGINNRDLKTFEVNIDRSLHMASQVPSQFPLIAESGISNAETIKLFRDKGFKGFLIGENFMKNPDPGNAFRDFMNKLLNND